MNIKREKKFEVELLDPWANETTDEQILKFTSDQGVQLGVY
jgi:hypothetical protein